MSHSRITAFIALTAISACLLVLSFTPLVGGQRDGQSAAPEAKSPVTSGTVTEYPNGVLKIAPSAFGITGPVRDLPSFDEQLVTSKREREEQRKQRQLDDGMTEDQIRTEEINRENAKRIKKKLPGAGAGEGPFQDALIKRGGEADAPQVMPAPSLTFEGIPHTVANVLPPDTVGDVGPNHYVQSTNANSSGQTAVGVFNKTTGAVITTFAMQSLFASLPAGDPCRVRDDGDPIVIYDPLADRWHLSQFALPANPNNFQCVALSVTGDPTGAYYVWSYLYPGAQINDYPKVGVWADAYHMTFNQFNNAGTAFLGAGILSQDRPKALAGDPTAGVVYINLLPIDANAGGLLPTDIDGVLAHPVGMAQILVEFRADDFGDPLDAIRPYRWVPNFVSPGSSTLTVLPDVALAAFDARQPASRANIEQLGGAALDSIGDRLMHRFAYRNLGTQAAPVNSFSGNFTVNVSGVNPTNAATYQTGIRWFEMRRSGDTLTVFDQGTHNLAPGNGANGLNNWMGSIAQDNDGNIALGFSQSGTGQNADIKIAGRTINVTNSGILNEGEALFFDALGSQTSTSNRWGDYSAMSVDPVDECTFWYTQEYYAATSSALWTTRIGKFVFPSCTPAEKATITGTITACSTGSPINQASVSATGGFNRLTNASGTYTMTVAPGTYTVGATKGVGFSSASAASVTLVNGQTATVNLCLTEIPVIASGGSAIISAGPNNTLDPGEVVTVALGLRNLGATNACTTALTGTLQPGGNVNSPSGPQNYGALCGGGPIVYRNFTFTVNPALACGGLVTATLTVADGATNYGPFIYIFATGSTVTANLENFDGVVAPALPAGWTGSFTGTGAAGTTVTTFPDTAPNAAFLQEQATVGISEVTSPAVAIASAGSQLSFRNEFNTEPGFDGMVLEIKVGAGAFQDIIAAGGAFASGGYNTTLATGFANPLPGRAAWAGLSGGSASAPAYITSVVTLPPAATGQNVQFKWRLGSDNSVLPATNPGARIDTLRLINIVCGGTAPVPQNALSQKAHGAVPGSPFSINLPLVPLTGGIGIEPRLGLVPGEHQVVVTFPAPVTVGGVAVTTGTGNAAAFSVAGNVVTINLTGVTNRQRLGLTLSSVSDGPNLGAVLVPMGLLEGDVNQVGGVTATDIAITKAAAGTATSSTFRADVIPQGQVNTSDIGLVKSRSGDSLP